MFFLEKIYPELCHPDGDTLLQRLLPGQGGIVVLVAHPVIELQ